MRLKSLSVAGFRVFSEKQTVEFRTDDSILGLVGINQATGSGSAAGKSSVMEALAQVLRFSDLPWSEQQSWLTDEKAQIEATFERDGQTIEISQGSKSYVKVDGTQVTNGSTGVKSWLQSFFGVEDLSILQKLTYRPQGGEGAFLSLKDSEKRAFLVQVLELERYEDLINSAAARESALNTELTTLQSTMNALRQPTVPPDQVEVFGSVVTRSEAIRSVAAFTNDLRNSLRALEADYATLQTGDLDFVLTGLREKRNALTEQVSAQVAAVTMSPDMTNVEAIQVEIKEYESALQKLQLTANETNKQISDSKLMTQKRESVISSFSDKVESIAQSVITLRTQLSKLLEDKCPTCERQWEQAKAKQTEIEAKIAELESQKASLLDKISMGKVVMAESSEELGKLTKRASDTQVAIVKAQNDINAKKAEARLAAETATVQANKARAFEIEKIRAQFKAQETELDTQIADTQSRIAVIREQQTKLASSISGTKLRIAEVEAKKREIELQTEFAAKSQEQLVAFEAQKTQYEKRIEEIQSKIKAVSDAKAVIKAFLGAISEEILAEIASATNSILARIPNTAGITIRFVTESVTGSGKIRQEIKPVITTEQKDGVSLKSGVSGGQRTSLGLAVDLAVSMVLRTRRGSKPTPNWIALDEVFDGWDSTLKDSFVDVMRSYGAQGVQFLVIDHGTELKEGFDSIIEVVASPTGSTINQRF